MRRTSRVGARSKEEVMADPLATAEETRKLPPLEAMAHPNCPREMWWGLAVDHPLEAPSTILYDLLTLEEPGRWEEQERVYAQPRTMQWARELPPVQGRLFAADCAEHVLPLFTRRYPSDYSLWDAIAFVRLNAKGKKLPQKKADAIAATLIAAQKTAQQDHNIESRERTDFIARRDARVAYLVACAVVSVLLERDPLGYGVNVLTCTQDAAGGAAETAIKGSYKQCTEALRTEAVWQWHRLIEYINGNVT